MLRARDLLLASTLLLWSSRADAQLNLEERQTDNWIAAQSALVSLLGVGSLLALTDSESVSAARLKRAPQFEQSTEDNGSPLTSRLSDITLLTSVALPFGTLYGGRDGASYGNSLLLHSQSMFASLLANTITKKLVLRARPYTHQDEYAPQSVDDNYSFYSGHSALSFTAATSGSLLFSAVEQGTPTSTVHWGATFALASFTAHARVRAGRHYPTDVLVGSALGIGFGLLTPVLHQVEFSPSPRDIAAAATGLASGSLLGFLLPQRTHADTLAFSPLMVPTPSGMMLLSTGRF